MLAHLPLCPAIIQLHIDICTINQPKYQQRLAIHLFILLGMTGAILVGQVNIKGLSLRLSLVSRVQHLFFRSEKVITSRSRCVDNGQEQEAEGVGDQLCRHQLSRWDNPTWQSSPQLVGQDCLGFDPLGRCRMDLLQLCPDGDPVQAVQLNYDNRFRQSSPLTIPSRLHLQPQPDPLWKLLPTVASMQKRKPQIRLVEVWSNEPFYKAVFTKIVHSIWSPNCL